MKTIVNLAAFVTAAVGLSGVAMAQTIDFTGVRATSEALGGIAYDAATGAIYDRESYGPGSPWFVRYDNAASFEAGTGGVKIEPSGTLGTYFSIVDGAIVGHYGSTTSSNPNSIGQWSGATGSLMATYSFPGFGGSNFSDTFDWGGYSAMNVLQDSTGTYLYSGSSVDNSFSLAKLGNDFSVSQLVTGLPGSPGFAFMAGGKLFVGSDFNRPVLNYSIDATTGFVDDFADIDLTGFGTTYITGLEYIEATDTLYAKSFQGLYKATGIGSALGLNVGGVPEPSTWAIMLLGFFAVGGALRASKRRQVRTVSYA